MMRHVTGRVGKAARAGAVLALVVLLAGCAAGPGARFEGRLGVPVRVTLADSTAYAATLHGLEAGALLLDREVPKSDDVVVVRSGGVDYVEMAGRVLGTAVEVRAFDIVVRESVAPEAVSRLDVRTRAYIGWGTAVAAVLAFALVLAIEDI
jgi:hypothetical protein